MAREVLVRPGSSPDPEEPFAIVDADELTLLLVDVADVELDIVEPVVDVAI